MSDLSFLIQTHNQVQIDKQFLQQCQQSNKQSQMKKTLTGLNKMFYNKQTKLNKTKTQLGLKGKQSLQKSFKNLFSSDHRTQMSINKSATTTVSEKEELTKITMRVDALQENQKRLQQKIGVEFFQIRQDIQRRNRQQSQQFEEVKRIKNDLNDTKRKIGQLLSLITIKNK